jgi:hypothetical protein
MSPKASVTVNKDTLTVRDAVFDLLRELGIRTLTWAQSDRQNSPGPT